MRRFIFMLSLFVPLWSAPGAHAATVLVTYDLDFGEFTGSQTGLVFGRQLTVAYHADTAGMIRTGPAALQTAAVSGTRSGGGGSYSDTTYLDLTNLGTLALAATASGGFANPSGSALFAFMTLRRQCGFSTCFTASTSRTVNVAAGGLNFVRTNPGATGLWRLLGTITFEDAAGGPFSAHQVEGVEVSRTIVPEPGTGWLLGVGVTLLGVVRRRFGSRPRPREAREVRCTSRS